MCSRFGIRDIPIVNSVPVTPSLNAAIYEEIPFDIQWGPQSTAPTFITEGPNAGFGLIDLPNAASTTSLRLNGNTFNLISLQICAPQHKTLLPMSKQLDCSGEFLLGFRSPALVSEAYIFLCVPILMGSTTTPSVYLEALRKEQLDGKPTSLLTVLPPTNTHFIRYSTCLQKREQTGTSIQQARVFVFTEGLVYPAASFLELSRKMTKPPTTGRVFLPTIQLPDGLVDKSEATLFSLTTETDYKSMLRYSQYYPKGQPDSSTTRKDSLDAYKCVPLEPSQNIKDGHIVVDTETGELLSQVVKEEEVGEVKTSKLSPAMVEKIIAIAIAFSLIVFVFLVLAYILANVTTPNADNFFGIIQSNAKTVAPIVLFSTLMAIVGFVLGVLLPMML